jgi:hypothetical protein
VILLPIALLNAGMDEESLSGGLEAKPPGRAAAGGTDSSILVHRVCLEGRDGNVEFNEGQRLIRKIRFHSEQEWSALEGLRKYRESIGLPPDLPLRTDPRFREMGAWVDGIAAWEIFLTTTFRPVIRRWGNPKGFAHLESIVDKPSAHSSLQRIATVGISTGDIKSRLLSASPSALYVEGFFHRFIRSLENDLHCRISYFVGFEAGKFSGTNHFHALLALSRAEGDFEFYRRGLWNWLFKNAGRSQVLPFLKDRGAGWYLTAAYVGKKQLTWDVHIDGKSHRTRRSKPGGRLDSIVPSPDLPRDSFHQSLQRWHR